MAPTPAPQPPDDRLARARRGVSIRLREKRAKDEAYFREHKRPRPNALREAGAFARWFLGHLLAHPDELDEILEAERIREEDEAARAKLRVGRSKDVSPEEGAALAAYRALRKGKP